MKKNILKSLVATFALVAIMTLIPIESVNAAEHGPTVETCAHSTLVLIDTYNDIYYFIDYNIHLWVAEGTYQCIDCGEMFEQTITVHEDHCYDDNGLCICGTYNDKDF